jgi:hypothetical protein
MKKLVFGIAAIAAGALLAPSPMMAHHALASQFDTSKTAKVTGVIEKVDWVNPHIYIMMDVTDEKGQVSRWSMETLPPAMMKRAGVRREAVAVGAKATAWGYPGRDATKNVLWPLSLTFEDGKVLQLMQPNQVDQFR